MRYITRLNTTRRLDDIENLVKFEILSIVIKRILGLLKEKIKNENMNHDLDENDLDLLCHLAVICDQIASQCTLFDFRDRQNRTYNRMETVEERELRAKCVDYVMAKLFPLDQVQILIDVILQEISSSQQRLRGTVKDNDQMKAMGNRTLEHTKKFLIKYLVYCQRNKYQVLQYLMHKDIFVGKRIRYSLLEEILEGSNQIQVSSQYIHLMCCSDQSEQMKIDDDPDAILNSEPYFSSLAFKSNFQIK